MRSNRLFHMCGNLICCCTSTLQYNARFAAKLQLDRCFCHCHDFAIVAANAEITKVLTSGLRKGGNHKEPAVAQHGQITLQSRRALSLSAYTESDNVQRGREVWLHDLAQPSSFFLHADRAVHRKKGWPCETKVWPHETRRIELKKVNTQSIPCCKD